MGSFHPSAVIDPKATVGRDVQIGPSCYVGPDVTLGDGCILHNNVTLTGRTTIGRGNVFFPTCVIGAEPQDLKFQGEPTELIIGDQNVFRELVTVHAGTGAGGGVTRVGSHNRFLVGVHVAHDMIIEDHTIIPNAVQLGGHVHVESYVTFGGLAAVHHFATVGRYAFVGGMTRALTDVPPFMIFQGYEGRVRGVNLKGMARWGFSQERLQPIRQAFKDLYTDRSRFGGPLLHRLERIESDGELTDDVRYLVGFVRRTIGEGRSGRYLESVRGRATRRKADFYEEGATGGSAS